MRKIDLNLATGKTINRRVFITLVAALFTASLLLAWMCIHTLQHYSRKSEAMKVQSQWQKKAVTAFTDKQREVEMLVSQKKKAWQARIGNCNQLIDKKSFSFCECLDFLENIIPSESFLEKLTLENSQNTLQCTLTAPSFAQMIKTYRKLSTHGMNISSEYEKDGSWHFILSVRYSDEKK